MKIFLLNPGPAQARHVLHLLVVRGPVHGGDGVPRPEGEPALREVLRGRGVPQVQGLREGHHRQVGQRHGRVVARRLLRLQGESPGRRIWMLS